MMFQGFYYRVCKSVTVFLLLLLCTLTVWAETRKESASFKSQFVRRSANKLVVGENDQPLFLRGVNFATYFMIAKNGEWYTEGEGEKKFPSPDADIPVIFHREWKDWFREEHFAMVAEAGFNVIRLPLTYRTFEDNSNPGRYKPAGWDLLDKYIAWAKQHAVYLILDMHIPQGGCQPCGGGRKLWDDPDVQLRFRKLWQEIARRYANEPIIAGYDLLNEPHPTSSRVDDEKDNIQWKTLAQQLTSDIRCVDENHLLIVEAVNWVDDSTIGDWSLEVLNGFQFLIDDDNVMYDIHFYFPFDYVFSEDLNRYPAAAKVRTIEGKRMQFDKKYLETELQTILNFATINNVPINVGEWSGPAIQKSGGLDYINDLLSLYDLHNVHWNFWSFLDFYRNAKMRDQDLDKDRLRIFEDYFQSVGNAAHPGSSN